MRGCRLAEVIAVVKSDKYSEGRLLCVKLGSIG